MESASGDKELFRCEQNRWLMLAGAVLCVAVAAFFARLATRTFRWPSFLLAGVFVPMSLYGSLRFAALIRYPRRYGIEVTSRGIGQPEAPGRPSLAWNEVAQMNSSVWGGCSLSDPTGRRRVRIWSEIPRFVEVLDVVLDRGSVAPPLVPLVVASPPWLKVGSFIMSLVMVALLGWLFVARGPSGLLWIVAAVLALAIREDWRRGGRVTRRVEIGLDAVKLSGRTGDVVVPWESVMQVRLAAARQGGLASILVRRDGSMVEVPSLRRSDALRVYHALRMRCHSTDPTATRRTTDFAASRRRQVIVALVGGLIAALSAAAAKSCDRSQHPVQAGP